MSTRLVRNRMALSKAALAFVVVILIIMVSLGVYFYLPSGQKGSVYVLYAGSLVNTMENSIGPSFRNASGYSFEGQGQGSLQAAQMILGNQIFPDVFISAGTGAMQLLQNQTHPYATWWASFATDQLVIAFGNKTTFADRLRAAQTNQSAWYSVLEQNGFRFGVSDPKLDPKGIYVILMFKLAAIYYNDSSLAGYMNSTHIHVFDEQTLPVEAQTGAVDAIIAYRHEAIEQKLSYITLPDKINLGNVSDSKYYAQVSTVVSGQARVGSPIAFCITIPSTVKNPQGAKDFVNFVLNSTTAKTLLVQHGFKLISPPSIGGNASSIPKLGS